MKNENQGMKNSSDFNFTGYLLFIFKKLDKIDKMLTRG